MTWRTDLPPWQMWIIGKWPTQWRDGWEVHPCYADWKGRWVTAEHGSDNIPVFNVRGPKQGPLEWMHLPRE